MQFPCHKCCLVFSTPGSKKKKHEPQCNGCKNPACPLCPARKRIRRGYVTPQPAPAQLPTPQQQEDPEDELYGGNLPVTGQQHAQPTVTSSHLQSGSTCDLAIAKVMQELQLSMVSEGCRVCVRSLVAASQPTQGRERLHGQRWPQV